MALRKEQKERLIKEFAINPKDTGSAELQVALLTENIRDLTEHCKTHHHDFSTKRGLLKMVCRRRKFLDYLAKKDHAKYKELIKKLGLRK